MEEGPDLGAPIPIKAPLGIPTTSGQLVSFQKGMGRGSGWSLTRTSPHGIQLPRKGPSRETSKQAENKRLPGSSHRTVWAWCPLPALSCLRLCPGSCVCHMSCVPCVLYPVPMSSVPCAPCPLFPMNCGPYILCLCPGVPCLVFPVYVLYSLCPCSVSCVYVMCPPHPVSCAGIPCCVFPMFCQRRTS